MVAENQDCYTSDPLNSIRQVSIPLPYTEDKVIGVIGGLGPAATMDFCNRIIRLTPTRCEQDHLRLLIDNNPKAPDRNLALAGKGLSPLSMFVQSAHFLQQGGADFLVMPCNTAHAFAEQITSSVTIPLVNIVDETVLALAQDVKKVGVLAADGCLAADLYQRRLRRAGLDFICLDRAAQADFMGLIYQIKQCGVDAATRCRMQALSQMLQNNGADVVIAGCTEVPLALDESGLSVPLIDSTEILARRAVAYAKNQVSLPVVGIDSLPLIVNA